MVEIMVNVSTVHLPHMDPMGFSKGLVHQQFQQNHLTLMFFDFQGEFLRHVQQAVTSSVLASAPCGF